MSPIHHVFGAGILDTCFEINGYADLPDITWNVTRILADAKLGKFGSPKRLRIDDLPPLDDHSWSNIDREKVNSIIASNDASVIDSPLVAVILEHKGAYHGMLVDGNHRLAARTLMGLETFTRYEVPPDLERNYRVTFI